MTKMNIQMMNNPWINILPASERIYSLRVNAEHPLDWFWSQDHSGRHVIFCDQIEIPVEIRLPEVMGLENFVFQSPYGKELKQLMLVLRDNANWELFYSLCMDLVRATGSANRSNAIQAIVRRLQKWQAFLEKDRQDMLSEEQIKGLLGELVFIEQHLAKKYGYANSIQFWTGPTGSPQDFCLEDIVVEVKTQLSSTRPEVHISSAEQLSCQANHLYLFVVTLGKGIDDSPSNVSLRSIISIIQDRLLPFSEELELFQDLLLATGYVDSSCYDPCVYTLIGTATYDVKDGFPRITVDDLPAGILKLNYSISLAACDHYKSCDGWIGDNTHD